MKSLRDLFFGATVLTLGVALLAGPASAAIEQRATIDGERLVLRNLIGEVRVEPGSGSFDVVVSIDGKDARPGLIELGRSDGQLEIRFPSDVRDYVYPRLDGKTDVSMDVDDGGWLKRLVGDMLGTGRIRVRPSGSGTELWADVTVRVPDGTSIRIEHAVGRIVAENVDAELELSTRSGEMRIDGTRGRLSAATGSGRIGLSRIDGERVEIATGSGGVLAEDCNGEEIQIATGSGSIELTTIRGRSMQVATGSGDVRARRVSADGLEIGTGSGDVTLELDSMGDGDYDVGTGSGDITLRMPAGATADVHAETHGGRVTVDLAGDVDFRTQEKDEVRLTVGQGGARVDLGSGSGDIRISN
jgi:hypothetical protein